MRKLKPSWATPTSPGAGRQPPAARPISASRPTVVIEYAPQGGTDHIHMVIPRSVQRLRAKMLKREWETPRAAAQARAAAALSALAGSSG